MQPQQLGSAIAKYKQTAIEMLRYTLPLLPIEELSTAIDYSIQKRMKNGKVYVENNYRHTKVNLTALELANYILDKEPIITAAGVMFKKHDADPNTNPLYRLINEFIDTRDRYKKEMFKYPKGSELYQKYNLLQALAKVDVNAIYGAIGQYSCVFYNLFIAEAITTQGQSYTKAMILAFEAFLGNNVLFGSLNEIMTFIHNVISEKPNRKFKDSNILDEDITIEECFFQIMSTTGFGGYIPSNEDFEIVWNTLLSLGQEEWNRLFYKNNLYYFMDNSSMTKAIEIILMKLNEPMLDPNHAPKEVEVEMEGLWELLKEYVFYNYQYIDRMDRVNIMIRKVVAAGDTDSCFIILDGWYRYNLAKVRNLPMRIRLLRSTGFTIEKPDEFGDLKLKQGFKIEETDYDYDFDMDDIIETEKRHNGFIISQEEGLRYTLVNIIAYCCSKLILTYMKDYTKNSNSYSENKPCFIIAKNEYTLKRMLLTSGKKNYASWQMIQEGHIVPEDSRLAITGLPIMKAQMAESTRDRLSKILAEDILKCEEIDQIKVIKSLNIFEKEIYNSILRGNTEYFKPVTVKSYEHYDDPMRNQGIKAMMVWNKLKDDISPSFDLHDRNGFFVVKIDINIKNIDRVKELRPDKYDTCIEIMTIKQFAKSIDVIALPYNETLPSWIIEFIDFSEIINNNLKNFPLDSIGISKMDKDSINYSNIVSF